MPLPASVSPFEGLSFGPMALGIIGGLALFLYGMALIADSLKALAGDGMSQLLARFTSNRVMGAVTGAGVTAVIQSSSVTTVLIVGFISAGLMSLEQSVGIIIGANIGSTVTAQIIAFKVTKSALLLVAAGFSLSALGRSAQLKLVGTFLLGLGLLFLGMSTMSDATSALRTHEPFIQAMRTFDQPLAALLAAAAFTAVVQSSAATTGIVIVLASQGFISLEVGILLALGANIGTCATALLASIGQPRTALQAAVVHVLFNILGALLWLPLVGVLAELATLISPTSEQLQGSARLAADSPRQIANAHTLFNVLNALLFLPASTLLARVVRKLVPDKPAETEERARPRYLDPAFLETPALAIHPLELELARFGRHVLELVESAAPGAGNESSERGGGIDVERIVDAEHSLSSLYEQILLYIRQLTAKQVSTKNTQRLEFITGTLAQLHNVADTVVLNLGAISTEAQRRDVAISDETARLLSELHSEVQRALELAVESVRSDDTAEADAVLRMKPQIAARADELSVHLSARLSADGEHRAATFHVENALVEALRRIYYFSKRIAKLRASLPAEAELLSTRPPPAVGE